MNMGGSSLGLTIISSYWFYIGIMGLFFLPFCFGHLSYFKLALLDVTG